MRLADDADLVGVGDRDVGLVIIEAGRPVEIVEDANPGPPRGARTAIVRPRSRASGAPPKRCASCCAAQGEIAIERLR